ncbi:MAG: hypothetical protein ABL907_12280 [Hyphomicrobium sp.]
MEKIPDETLMAYADGALDDSECRKVEAMLAANPAQHARLAPYVVTRSALPEIFSEALTSKVPDRLVTTIMTTPIGTRAPARATRSANTTQSGSSFAARLRDLLFPAMPSFSSALALCSTVAVIAGAGWLAGHATRPADGSLAAISVEDETLYAAGPLRVALETAASNAAIEEGALIATPALTFMSQDGRVCRQYDLVRAGKDKRSGFACRSGNGRWQIAFHAPAPPAATGEASVNRPAGSETFEALEGAVDKTIKGDIFTAKDEASLLANGWRGANGH